MALIWKLHVQMSLNVVWLRIMHFVYISLESAWLALAYADDEDCGHISIREHVIILYFYYIFSV